MVAAAAARAVLRQRRASGSAEPEHWQGRWLRLSCAGLRPTLAAAAGNSAVDGPSD